MDKSAHINALATALLCGERGRHVLSNPTYEEGMISSGAEEDTIEAIP
jgi:hypothetical protein